MQMSTRAILSAARVALRAGHLGQASLLNEGMIPALQIPDSIASLEQAHWNNYRDEDLNIRLVPNIKLLGTNHFVPACAHQVAKAMNRHRLVSVGVEYNQQDEFYMAHMLHYLESLGLLQELEQAPFTQEQLIHRRFENKPLYEDVFGRMERQMGVACFDFVHQIKMLGFPEGMEFYMARWLAYRKGIAVVHLDLPYDRRQQITEWANGLQSSFHVPMPGLKDFPGVDAHIIADQQSKEYRRALSDLRSYVEATEGVRIMLEEEANKAKGVRSQDDRAIELAAKLYGKLQLNEAWLERYLLMPPLVGLHIACQTPEFVMGLAERDNTMAEALIKASRRGPVLGVVGQAHLGGLLWRIQHRLGVLPAVPAAQPHPASSAVQVFYAQPAAAGLQPASTPAQAATKSTTEAAPATAQVQAAPASPVASDALNTSGQEPPAAVPALQLVQAGMQFLAHSASTMASLQRRGQDVYRQQMLRLERQLALKLREDRKFDMPQAGLAVLRDEAEGPRGISGITGEGLAATPRPVKPAGLPKDGLQGLTKQLIKGRLLKGPTPQQIQSLPEVKENLKYMRAREQEEIKQRARGHRHNNQYQHRWGRASDKGSSSSTNNNNSERSKHRQ
mmetsp:Transcript_36157/g.91333  ORF Transcript_36157/g.91333 Transcript_36157/m.91333 type:complete len:619 (-) Transcript_36157:906-2762(-)